MSNGYIKLHRKLQDNPLWYSEKFTRGQAWVDLMLLANHTYGFFFIRGNKVEVQRGQVGWSVVKLAARWKWSRSKVNNYLNQLEKEQQVELEKSKVYTLITIINYEEYQKKEQQTVQQKGNRKATEKQQKDTNNNDKNNKNDKKKDNRFKKPQIEMIEMYFNERGITGLNGKKESEKFYDFYESKNWFVGKNKMSDWKAAVRNWIRGMKDKKQTKKQGTIDNDAADKWRKI